MKTIRVGAAALNQTPLDWEGNLARIESSIEAARRARVSVLCLPEACITGYGCEDAFHAEFVHETAWAQLEKLLPRTKGIIVGLGLPVFHGSALFDAAALLCGGELLGVAAKKYLAGDGIHYEPRWFKAWAPGAVDHLRRAGSKVPFGDLMFRCGEAGIGFEICEEAWVPNRPGAALAAKGVDIILNPSASHFAFGKMETRRRFVIEGSRAFGAAYCYANLLGNEAGRVIYDGSCLVASEGRILASGRRFGFADCSLTWADVDLTQNRMGRARSASFAPWSCAPGSASSEGQVVSRPFSFPEIRTAPAADPAAAAAWESGPALKEEEFTRAVALGLFDYLRRSRSHGFVVSLSGGADSSATTCLAAFSLRLALSDLGPKGLAEKLRHVRGLGAAAEGRTLTKRLLTCVYQGTENSSQASREAARAVARGIGADLIEWDVGPVNAAYVDLVSKALGRPLTWREDDVALQNIQARSRAPGVWLLANLRKSLLLATSDRSEAAVGYATMDGDTCGGLSPVAGVDKTFLLSWLAWLEKKGPEGLGPVPELAAVTCQRPTPELRPPSASQAAEDDLMPYEVLDAVERAFILEKRSPADALREVKARFPQHCEADLKAWVGRFFSLWCQNQWKRERYAPSFHLDDQNVDPRSWCRFPILSSGLKKEIAEL
ncbi:MAG: NAD+ synthetase [Elusimicrobia bacterium]|nr:NAD+ synthetase [Elusimicrobiota bacterium]